MNYENFVADFAARTRANLEVLRKLRKDQPEAEVYEVTQLVNSMLGLMVLPWERAPGTISEAPAEVLSWPRRRPGGINGPRDLRRLRNAIAHFNIEFLSDERNGISGIRVWNEQGGKRNWERELRLEDLEEISQRHSRRGRKAGKELGFEHVGRIGQPVGEALRNLREGE